MMKGIKMSVNHLIFCLAVVIVMVVVDQITKILAFKYFEFGDEISVIPNIIDFILVKNTGAVFGILKGKMFLFYIVTFLGLGIFGYLLKDGNLNTMPFYTIGISLMIAGTIGNFIDRVCFNYVRDFITFGFFDFPSFNVADMCMCVGIVMFFIDTLFGEAKILWK